MDASRRDGGCDARHVWCRPQGIASRAWPVWPCVQGRRWRRASRCALPARLAAVAVGHHGLCARPWNARCRAFCLGCKVRQRRSQAVVPCVQGSQACTQGGDTRRLGLFSLRVGMQRLRAGQEGLHAPCRALRLRREHLCAGWHGDGARVDARRVGPGQEWAGLQRSPATSAVRWVASGGPRSSVQPSARPLAKCGRGDGDSQC